MSSKKYNYDVKFSELIPFLMNNEGSFEGFFLPKGALMFTLLSEII
jgi:hypothetical protein